MLGTLIRRWLRKPGELREFLWRRRHMARMMQSLGGEGARAEYLKGQLERSLPKHGSPLQPRSRYFIDAIGGAVGIEGRAVLCVGCRNTAELNYFREKGAKSAVGIDLFSTDRNILVMDMHAMKFEDTAFDLVYSSHSLEHASDPRRAVGEFMRVAKPGGFVAIETPAGFQPQGADLHDFGSAGRLQELAGDKLAAVAWSEDCPAGDPRAFGPHGVARLVFVVR